MNRLIQPLTVGIVAFINRAMTLRIYMGCGIHWMRFVHTPLIMVIQICLMRNRRGA